MLAAILFVTVMLLAAVALRLRFPLFRWLYLPSSVIAGGLGLLAIRTAPGGLEGTATSIAATLETWPSWLIAIVFAGMLLERKPSPIRRTLPRVARQGLMVWVIVLGQTAVGLLATGLLIRPSFDVPRSFGMLIETGFAGGHGTAAAMGQVYAHPTIGLAEGLDLGTLMATCGLVFGLVSGVMWINIAARIGWLRGGQRIDPAPAAASQTESNRPGGEGPGGEGGVGEGGVTPPREFGPIGWGRVGAETIDPLLFQALLLMAAFAIGVGLHAGVGWIAGGVDRWWFAGAELSGEDSLAERLTFAGVLGDFPLFIYTLFGGLAVRGLLVVSGRGGVIDHDTINRLTAASMDVLVVAAIASLNLTAVASLMVPFSILFLAGAVWAAVCLLLLSRWILPSDYWFQLGLINYGMSTGTTATGFVLLKMVDPDLESGAAEDYAMAAPLSSPFIGGGMLTVALPLLVLERVPIWIPCAVLWAVVIGLIVIGRRWNGYRRAIGKR